MLINMNGMDIELTVDEYLELLEKTNMPKPLTLEEEVKLVESLRHFTIVSWKWDDKSAIYITLKRNRG